MKPIQIISQDLFDKVRSRFSNLEMGDETGAVTIDPVDARFFDFDFVNEGVDLGRVSVSLNDVGSLKIYYSQGITENQDDRATQMWYDFLKEMRMFAMRRLLRFDTRDIAKTNLDKNDFQHLAATQGPKEEPDMNTMNESRWNNKSSSKTSRAVQGKTEVIVRHAKAVEETYPGARSQSKNIKAIFIQNADGERAKYPFIHLAGAFAMAQHVDHGGVPHDPAGKAIIKMSENIAKLGEFQRHIQRSSLHADATGIAERAIGHMNELKARVASLGKRHHYQAWKQEFENAGAAPSDDEVVLDAVTMEEYKSKFTQTNFQEELAGYFPLIHKIMSEVNTVNLESYVSEATCSTCHCDPCECDSDEKEVKESAFMQFEEWAEATEQGKLTDDQLNQLKAAVEALPQGPAGPELDFMTATDFFSNPDFGLTNLPGFEELETSLEDEQNRSEDIRATPIQLFQAWAKDNNPDLLASLGMQGAEEQPAAPAPEAPPEAAPAPVAPEQPVAEGKEGNMVQEVAKIVKSFYNRDNPEVGPFRGGEGIATDVEKQISEKFGEEAGQQAREMAEMFMEKLTNEWHQRHGQTHAVEPTDGLARLKELLDTVKTKVECMAPGGGAGSNSLGKMRSLLDNVKAKVETYAPEMEEGGPDKSQVPAALRKEKGGDWKMSTKDLDKERTQSPTSPEGLKALQQKLGMHEELSSIMKLAGLGEGSGPKAKQKTPYRDINGPEYKAAADKQKEKMAKDKAAEPGKALLAKKK